MNIYSYHEHKGFFVKSQHWISLDKSLDAECIFLLLSLKNGDLLRTYYDSLPPEDHENHRHLKTAHNGFKFTDGTAYGVGLAIQGGKEGPEGLLLPLKSFQQEFCFDRIRDTIGNNIHSKETERYSYSLYKIILKLDSLLIHLSENKELNK